MQLFSELLSKTYHKYMVSHSLKQQKRFSASFLYPLGKA